MDGLHEFRVVRTDQDEQNFFEFEGGATTTMQDNFPGLHTFAYVNDYEDGMAPSDRNPELNDLINMDILSHANVTRLDLSAQMHTATQELDLLTRFGTTFPSVTHLHLSISSRALREGLPRIWTAWPQLEFLIIKCENLQSNDDSDDDESDDGDEEEQKAVSLDEAFSGVPEPPSEAGRKKLLDKLTTMEELRARLGKFKIGPGLSDLTRLKKLVLDFSECDSCPFYMGDVGGYFGLATLNKDFQHFEIIGSSVEIDEGVDDNLESMGHRVSEECKELIRAALGPHVVLKFGDEDDNEDQE
jgi:hypothetical protein